MYDMPTLNVCQYKMGIPIDMDSFIRFLIYRKIKNIYVDENYLYVSDMKFDLPKTVVLTDIVIHFNKEYVVCEKYQNFTLPENKGGI